MKLRDKNIIVTGGTQGLGRAIASNLANKGARVITISRNDSDYKCDITNKEQVKVTIEKIIKDHKKIHGLINGAGAWLKMTPLEEVNLEEVEKVLDTNLKGLIFITKEVLPYLKKNKESVLINISSKSGTRPMDLQAVYCASKFGVKGFTDTLKLELKGSPVKVLGFYPSGMNTKMFEKAGEDFSSNDFMDVDEIAEIISFSIERPGNISIEEVQIEKY